MSKEKIFSMIRRNKHPKNKAITYIADFLCIDKKSAKKIYEEEFEGKFDKTK